MTKQIVRRLNSSMDSYDYNSSGWSNTSNGFGMQTDPNYNTRFLPPVELSGQMLQVLYRYNPLINSYVNLWKGDATRKGFELIDSKDAEKGNKICKELKKRFKINGTISKAVGVERLHGGGVIFCDVEDGNLPKDPINEKTVRKINGFTVIEKEYARPYTYNDLIGSEDPGEPMHYQITLGNQAMSKTIEVHSSRLIRIPEIKCDDNLSTIQFTGSGHPTWPTTPIQKAYDSVKRYGVGLSSVSQHLQNLVVDIFKIHKLDNKQNPDAYKKYIQNQWKLKNSMKANIIGEDDDLSRIGTPLTGVDGILDQINKDVAMALGMSLSLLFSLESGALGGSTVQGDRLNWFDKVKSYQERHLVAVVERMVYLLGLEHKQDYSEIVVEFNSLQELSEIEKMEVRDKALDSMGKLVSMGYPAKDALDSMLSGNKLDLDTFNYNPDEIEEYLSGREEDLNQREESQGDGEEDN